MHFNGRLQRYKRKHVFPFATSSMESLAPRRGPRSALRELLHYLYFVLLGAEINRWTKNQNSPDGCDGPQAFVQYQNSQHGSD